MSDKIFNNQIETANVAENSSAIDIDKAVLKKYYKEFRKATLMDDHKFRKICESKEAIEEILRAVLKDSKLKVIEIIKQSEEGMPVFHGVILDCKCRLKTKEIVNIEVQVANDDDPIYRMRYNASILTVENSPKKKKFKYKDLPKLIMIMFCEFDLFKKGKPIYEIIRYVKDTKVVADEGIREIYINLKAKVTDKKLKSLFKIMTTVDNTDDKEFPKLSITKDRVNKLYLGGENNMAGLDLMMYNDGVKAGIKEGRAEGSMSSVVNLYKKGLITIEVAAEELNMSTEEFKESLDR